MDRDDRFFRGALARIVRLMAVLTVAVCAGGLIWAGWRWSAGFFLGAVASYLNFRWLKRLVDSLGRVSTGLGPPPGSRMAVILGLRYGLLGLSAYGILSYSSLSLAAALAGLFVAVAAVVLEILFELIYAGT